MQQPVVSGINSVSEVSSLVTTWSGRGPGENWIRTKALRLGHRDLNLTVKIAVTVRLTVAKV